MGKFGIIKVSHCHKNEYKLGMYLVKRVKFSTSPSLILEIGIIKNFVVAFQNVYAYRNIF